jgi:hypothetical protein
MIREQIEENLGAAFDPVFSKSWMKAIVTTSRQALKVILKWCW